MPSALPLRGNLGLRRLSGYSRPEAPLLSWLGSVPLQGYQTGSATVQVLWSEETRGYTQRLGKDVNVLLFLTGVVEEAP